MRTWRWWTRTGRLTRPLFHVLLASSSSQCTGRVLLTRTPPLWRHTESRLRVRDRTCNRVLTHTRASTRANTACANTHARHETSVRHTLTPFARLAWFLYADFFHDPPASRCSPPSSVFFPPSFSSPCSPLFFFLPLFLLLALLLTLFSWRLRSDEYIGNHVFLHSFFPPDLFELLSCSAICRSHQWNDCRLQSKQETRNCWY